MNLVLRVLKDEERKLTDKQLVELTGLSRDAVRTALHRLLLGRLIECDSFETSKRGGQAGVRRWGGHSLAPLWQIAREHLEE